MRSQTTMLDTNLYYGWKVIVDDNDNTVIGLLNHIPDTDVITVKVPWSVTWGAVLRSDLIDIIKRICCEAKVRNTINYQRDGMLDVLVRHSVEQSNNLTEETQMENTNLEQKAPTKEITDIRLAAAWMLVNNLDLKTFQGALHTMRDKLSNYGKPSAELLDELAKTINVYVPTSCAELVSTTDTINRRLVDIANKSIFHVAEQYVPTSGDVYSVNAHLISNKALLKYLSSSSMGLTPAMIQYLDIENQEITKELRANFLEYHQNPNQTIDTYKDLTDLIATAQHCKNEANKFICAVTKD